MLNNLKAELVKKGLKPEHAICNVTGCCYSTASKKLKGVREFTVPEALKIVEVYFPNDNFSWEYLFDEQSNPS